jgi:Raf kinase inhibitor-like YbhB/YbcL family protein
MKWNKLLSLSLLGLVFCGQPTVKTPPPKPATNAGQSTDFALTSPAFPDNTTIPVRYTGKGENISPALSWSNYPANTQTFALIVDDPDAPGRTWTHWMIFNIPPTALTPSGLPESTPGTQVLSNGARQLKNDGGNFGYTGPMPPPGKPHHYIFALYALDMALSPELIDTKAKLLASMQGHILAQTKLVGLFQR